MARLYTPVFRVAAARTSQFASSRLYAVGELRLLWQKVDEEKKRLSDEVSNNKLELSQRLSNEQVQKLIAEKEESIQGLLAEGDWNS